MSKIAMWLAFSVMWISVAGAVAFAVYHLDSGLPLFALLIPTLITFRS